MSKEKRRFPGLHLPLTVGLVKGLLCLSVTLLCCCVAAAEQETIAWVEKMPRLPEPLIIRDWTEVSRKYYRLVLNLEHEIDGRKLLVVTSGEDGKPGKTSVPVSFRIPSYMAGKPGSEIFTCLSAVAGARLVGLDPNQLAGTDLVKAAQNWFDPDHGLYRHSPGDRSPKLHSGIYGYWSSFYGLVLAALYPNDKVLTQHACATAETFLKVARGLGCPDSPNFNTLGFNFETGEPGGRNEPMNRLGNAPLVAWVLLVGNRLVNDPAMLDCSRATMRWYLEHPGRYENTHLMGPVTVARLNAEHGASLDLGRALAAWFGDGDQKTHGWGITAGIRLGGVTCDGIDGARWNREGTRFLGFAMGTLCGPASLLPVARYDPRYARSLARYALHAAASARLFQGYQLDWEHQDHKDWKDKWDPDNLFFYESVARTEPSEEKKFSPYATGDPLRLGWGCEKVGPRQYLAKKREWFSKSCNNLSLYMGNHVGFLGGPFRLTESPGVLRWDCLATDWFHSEAYPTYLYYNPHSDVRQVRVELDQPADLYDAVSHRFLARAAEPDHPLTLAPDQAVVLVAAPPNGKLARDSKRLTVDGVVVDYRYGEAGEAS